jgi:hypothetical protein
LGHKQPIVLITKQQYSWSWCYVVKGNISGEKRYHGRARVMLAGMRLQDARTSTRSPPPHGRYMKRLKFRVLHREQSLQNQPHLVDPGQ